MVRAGLIVFVVGAVVVVASVAALPAAVFVLMVPLGVWRTMPRQQRRQVLGRGS